MDLTMMYNTQDWCVCELCQSSAILKAREHGVSETRSVPILTYFVWPLRKRLPSIIGGTPFHLRMEIGQVPKCFVL
jgi:hypothetical protein